VVDGPRADSSPLDLSLFPVARAFRTRLRGLAWRRRPQAGPGLLIPRCSSVHTFGMRFELDVFFLDGDGQVLSVRRQVPPRRVLWCRGAAAILEIPSPQGGEFEGAQGLDTHAP
jgi:uncharacterized membrane protein (UPF0127 family)